MQNFLRIPLLIMILGLSFLSCKQTTHAQKQLPQRNLSSQFKDYWYQGTAEVSTYELSENRYGQLRNGKATLIYVTEDFVPKKQVKADKNNPNNISVLKLNSVKKFVTGVYPYSIMQSSFLPLQTKAHAIKISTSIQEWCGQTFIQLNNRKQYEINAYSYFESEGDQQLKIDKTYTENEIWNLIRLDGLKSLPVGEITLLPSFEYLRLNHKEIKSYKATVSSSSEKGFINYAVNYPNLNRRLIITFNAKAPYIIESWSDHIGTNQPTTAKRITTKKIPYWQQNAKKFEPLRNELGLE